MAAGRPSGIRRPTRDEVGFLDRNLTVEFGSGRVYAVADFEERSRLVKEASNVDGFYYPPREWRETVRGTRRKKIPRTDRPAHLFQLPSSHVIELPGRWSAESYRRGLSAFVMHLLAYLHGTRLQFHDWWFDCRVPVNARQDFFVPERQVGPTLDVALKTWRSWTPRQRRMATNVLFMHCRSPSYDWDWERFMIEYMVTDGCWRLTAPQLRLRRNPPHADRISLMCRHFGLRSRKRRFEQFVRLRNELQHETLWAGKMPGTAVPDAFGAYYDLRRLNLRLIAAVLDLKKKVLVRTAWWSHTPPPFR